MEIADILGLQFCLLLFYKNNNLCKYFEHIALIELVMSCVVQLLQHIITRFCSRITNNKILKK